MAQKNFKGLYRQKSRRNPTHDYTSECWYMVTINTLNRKNYFGRIETTGHDPSLQHTEIAHIAMDCWNQIPKHFPNVRLDTFIIMPDHIHGLLKIESNPSKKTHLASIVGLFKSATKRMANLNKIDFHWQNRYHDSIIYTEEILNQFRKYIDENVLRYKKV